MKHWRKKYWLGSWEIWTSEPGPNFSHASSSRQRYQGNQPHVPSRNAQRRRGWRSSTPPAAMLPNAIISSMGFRPATPITRPLRSEEHTSELQSRFDLVCRLLLEKKNKVMIRLIVAYHPTQDTN